jgi:glycosyltransferase involved in cell wall biosynthesis
MAERLSDGLTVGIPVFNGENTLALSLKSLTSIKPEYLASVILSDNASIDRSYFIAREFESKIPVLEVYRQEYNIGAMANFWFVMQLCRTEYFMWLAADDVILSFDYLEVDGLFKRYPNAIAVSPLAYVREGGSVVLDRGNGPLVSGCGIDICKFMLRPGVNSRFYSIYRTSAVRSLFQEIFGKASQAYFASDVVFSAAVIARGPWPCASGFLLDRMPGMSADGWLLRKALAKGRLEALFPSARFVREIARIAPRWWRTGALLMASLLYIRYVLGPLRHRIKRVFHG